VAPTEPWQGEYDGWLFGNGTVFGWSADGDAITGLEDLPDQRGDDHPLAADDGMFPGTRWLAGRQVILSFKLTPADEATTRASVNAMKAATRKRQTEAPLQIWLPEQGIVQLNARPRSRTVPINELFRQGAPRAMVEFVCSDPVLYSATLDETTVPVFVAAGGGFSYPVDYPKDYGGASSGGTVTVPNDGDWPTWARFILNGPSSGAIDIERIENVTDGLELDFTSDGGLTIAAGEQVIVETHPARRTVAFDDGASRWNTVAGNEWWQIQPGGAALRLRASGDTTGASCTAQTRDAYL
jgi:hypothetical protein